MIDSEARWSLLLSQILVKIKSEHVSHVVVVLLEVGEILLAGKSSRVQVWHLAFSDRVSDNSVNTVARLELARGERAISSELESLLDHVIAFSNQLQIIFISYNN